MSTKTSPAALPACPVETTLAMIGDKWKVMILRDLMPGKKRFGELRKSIGSVSQKVLTSKLRAMKESGLVNRTVFAEVPPRIEYSLTKLGCSLEPVLHAMRKWGEDYKACSVQPRKLHDQRKNHSKQGWFFVRATMGSVCKEGISFSDSGGAEAQTQIL